MSCAGVAAEELRTVIEHRDGGCVVPGCAQTRWLMIHHLVHWEDGGCTDPTNLVALCSRHHRAVHHDELTIHGNPDQPRSLRFADGRGRSVGPSPPRAPDRQPQQTAAALGIGEPRYEARSGERADWRWFSWRDPPAA